MNKKNLIILGNGADLYCGLPSKFSDYINFMENKYNLSNKIHSLKEKYDNFLFKDNFKQSTQFERLLFIKKQWWKLIYLAI